jgi:hypothetical protein
MGRYEADNLFVKNAKGNDVAAKYLKDTNGNYIIDRLSGRPYLVPADFNLDAVIAKYKVDPQALTDPEPGVAVRAAGPY